MKKLIIILLLITTNIFSQNKDSYLTLVIEDGLYEYFDSLDVEQLYEKSDCNCEMVSESVVIFFVNKEESKSLDIDEICLNDEDIDDFANDYINDYKKFINKQNIKFKQVNVDINIKRNYIRFNIFRFKYKINYKVIVTYKYNPVKI